MRKLTLLVLGMLLTMTFGSPALADTVSPPDAQGPDAADQVVGKPYEFPVIPPSVTLFGGLRYVDSNGSDRAEEFEYLHNSIVLGGEARFFSFPHRFHLDLDVRNKKDYFGDLSYAYEDIILFRGINRTLFHNIENIALIDLDPSTPSPGVDVRDAGKRYGITMGITRLFLRFKKHDYPFHVYLDGTVVTLEGDRQQRSLLGSGYFTDIVRASQSRSVDNETKDIIIGVNSHLGPVEADLSHGEKRFDSGGDRVLYDSYSASPFRAAGVYPHNLVPDIRTSTDTLKVHTSYTGSIVASATVSKTHKENEDSKAKAGYFVGAAEVTWTESPSLAFFLRYRHKEVDPDSPRSVTITDRTDASNSYTYLVPSALSSITESAAATVRYRPLHGLTVRADYTYDDIRRSDAAIWGVPDETQKNAASLSADMRLVRGLNLKGRYTHRYTTDPTYNSDPEEADEGSLSANWMPLPQVIALLNYSLAKEKRNNLLFTDTASARRRDAKRDRLLGSVSCLLTADLTATVSFAYVHSKTKQDIEFHDASGLPLIDPSVPSTDMAHSYSLDVAYTPRERVTLNAGITHTRSSGAFYPDDADLLQPVSIASFSEMKTRETVYSVSGDYTLKNGVQTGIHYRYTDFNDALNNPYDDVQDGRAHTVILVLTKKW